MGPYKFEIGETIVTYYAVDASGNGAKCNFTVTILDMEAPIFENCQDPPPYLVGKEGILIEWDEPHVTDNSGNELSILKSIDFGPLPIGTTKVEYTAVDLFNNSNSCVLNITVQLSSCENEIPRGLDQCDSGPDGLFCVVTCEEGYAFAMSDKATCESPSINWIVPECTPTEIPKEISGEVEKDCKELKENCKGGDCYLIECEEDNIIRNKRQVMKEKKRTRFRIRINRPLNFEERFKGINPETFKPKCRNGSIPHRTKKFRCVRCPKGFFQNASTCDPCPINTYNDKIGSTKCERCPLGTFTRSKKGSKMIKACKIRLGTKFRSLTRKEPCKNDTCLNGKCISVGTTRHRCACFDSWVGARCRIQRIDHCATEPCLNGGTCSLQPTTNIGYSCHCPNGFTGLSCGIEEILEDPPFPKIDICKQVNNLCENNGICVPDKKSRGAYKCICPPGFLGRRCQNVPCDYRPCQENNVCVNLLQDGEDTTKNSYRCDCPDGKMGPPKCLEDTPVLDQCGGCQNGGICHSGEFCECTKDYTGKLCQETLTGDYILNFKVSGVTDFVLMEAPQSILNEFTFCAWLETNNTFNYGTILSYATTEMDNALTLIDYTGLVLWINGKYVVTNVKINDGIWHHVCISWRSSSGDFLISVDSTIRASGTGLSIGRPILGGGSIVLGQDQDFPRGGFSRSESFVGQMAHVDLWDRKFEEEEMKHDCGTYEGGNFVSWKEFRKGVKGGTKVLKSNFCNGCRAPVVTVPGGTWQVSLKFFSTPVHKVIASHIGSSA